MNDAPARRKVLLAAAGLLAAPLARAERMPVIGFLSSGSPASFAHFSTRFRAGLKDMGFVEGRNVAVEYRWAEGRFERLPAQADELVKRRVALIVAGGGAITAVSAEAATRDIPIVFIVGLDPVAAGLVASFSRPGGNATGVSLVTAPLGEKRIELFREITPRASTVTMLVNPASPDAAPEIRDIEAAARSIHFDIKLVKAAAPAEIDAVFAALARKKPEAMLIGSDPFFMSRREQIVAHVARLGVPAIYPFREFVSAGGLLSYGTSISQAYHEAGIYAGRILKGVKPGDLPVLQPTTFQLVLNLTAAKKLGVPVSADLLARVDEVIQ